MIFFLFLLKTLIVGRRGGSNEYPKSMFWSKNKKIGIPLQPQFFYIKVGFTGYTFHGHVFLMITFMPRSGFHRSEASCSQKIFYDRPAVHGNEGVLTIGYLSEGDFLCGRAGKEKQKLKISHSTSALEQSVKLLQD